MSRHEWPTLPLIEEWADVAVVEGAWVEDGSAVRRAVQEVEARGWDRAVFMLDEWAIYKALEIADLRPDLVQAFVHGHACPHLTTDGPRPSLNPSVVETYSQLLRTDFTMYARVITQTTRGDYDDAQVEAFLSEVSHEEVIAMFERIYARNGEPFVPSLRKLGVPLLLAHHSECLLWTEEGYEDVVAEFPEATKVTVTAKPSTSPEFVDHLREFCASLA